MDFSRRSDHPLNAVLNYGYTILLSAFNREIAACGYATQLGLHHDNVFNQFNLSSDLMEPFRILIDRDKLFVLVGLRSFFANDRVELFLKTVLEHGYRVLLLDSIAREKLPSEKRLTIDNDPTRFSEEESGKYGYLH